MEKKKEQLWDILRVSPAKIAEQTDWQSSCNGVWVDIDLKAETSSNGTKGKDMQGLPAMTFYII